MDTCRTAGARQVTVVSLSTSGQFAGSIALHRTERFRAESASGHTPSSGWRDWGMERGTGNRS
jgi:hypothetical protein